MALDLLTSPEITEALKKAPPHQAMAYAARMAWLAKAHDHQKMPPGDWWSILLLLAGRGAGKTRYRGGTDLVVGLAIPKHPLVSKRPYKQRRKKHHL